MLTDEWLIAIGVGLFVAGGLVGFLIRMFAFGGSRKEADLARSLEEAEKQLADYKQEVLERFSDTAEKFRRLNESYTDLHQQLAESAVALCGDEVTTPPLLEVRAERLSEAPPASEPQVNNDAEAGAAGEGTDTAEGPPAGESTATQGADGKPSADRPAAP